MYREINFLNRREIVFRLMLLLFLFVTAATSAFSQSIIKGIVRNDQGGRVPGARVVLSSRTGLQLSTNTEASGAFSFRDVKSGIYLLEVHAEGFSLYTSDEIETKGNEIKNVEVVLKVAAINASVVVTANGTVERVEEVAKVISTLQSEDIEAKHELSLAEALRGIPGLRVQQQGSPGALTTLRLRGLRNFDTAFLFDGLRVRDAGEINGSAVSLISDLVPVALDRIEVLRGSGSSIYGTHAIAGVINMIPETGVDGLHFNAGFEAGGLATYRERLQTTGGSTRLGYSLGVNRLDVRKGIDGDDEYGSTGFAGRVQYSPLASITIGANLYGTISNARVNDNPFALPAAFFAGVDFPRAVAGTNFQQDFNNPDQGRRNRLLVGSVRFSQLVNDRISYSVAYQRTGTNRRNYNGPEVDPRFAQFVPFGDFEFLSVNRGSIDTLDARVNIQFSRSNLATVGVEYERESFFQSSEPSFNALNNTTDRQRTFAVFGQDQVSFFQDRLRLSIGVRGQAYRIRSADRPGVLQGVTADNSVTGDGSVAYFLGGSRKTKLRAHIGNGFRAPSLFERFGEGHLSGAGVVRFGDPTLKAEQSISVDGGFDQRLGSDRFWFGATYFYTRLQRVVAFTSFASDPLGLGRFTGYENQPGGLARGAEGFLDASPFRGTNVRASYTFTNSDRFVPKLGLRPEYVIPNHSIGLTWTQRYRAFLLSLDVNRTGDYIAPVFENNFPFRMAELTFSGYTKADVFGTYEKSIGDKVTLRFFGGLENLLHETYYENGFVAPKTVGRGGLQVRF